MKNFVHRIRIIKNKPHSMWKIKLKKKKKKWELQKIRIYETVFKGCNFYRQIKAFESMLYENQFDFIFIYFAEYFSV